MTQTNYYTSFNTPWWSHDIHYPRYLPFVGGIYRSQRASDAELWRLIWRKLEQTVEQTVKLPVILRSHGAHHCNTKHLSRLWLDFGRTLSAFSQNLKETTLHNYLHCKLPHWIPHVDNATKNMHSIFHGEHLITGWIIYAPPTTTDIFSMQTRPNQPHCLGDRANKIMKQNIVL